jgi:hypothetical protein
MGVARMVGLLGISTADEKQKYGAGRSAVNEQPKEFIRAAGRNGECWPGFTE